MSKEKLRVLLKASKASVALLGAILTAAAGIWTGNEFITFGLAVVTALTVFFTKNAKTLDDLLNDLGDKVGKDHPVAVVIPAHQPDEPIEA